MMMFKLVLVLLAFAAAALARPEYSTIFLNNTSTNSNYYISQVEMEYLEAYVTCKQYGWALATELTPEDTLAINAALTAAKATEQFYYIGGVRLSEIFYHSWIWMDSGEDIGYTYWTNNIEPFDSDCLARRPIATHSGTWASTDCYFKHNFICQTEQ